MCKLLASYGDPFSSDVLGDFYCNAGRANPHASGMLTIEENTKQVHYLKAPVSGPVFWMRKKSVLIERTRVADIGLYHVRFATHGSPRNCKNNHPIIHCHSNGKFSSALVHNGVVTPPDWIKGRGETDSEQLLLYAEKEGFSSWSYFSGWAAVAMRMHSKLYVYHNIAPLYYRQTEKGFQFRQNLLVGFVSLPVNIVFEVRKDSLIPVKEVEMRCSVVYSQDFDDQACFFPIKNAHQTSYLSERNAFYHPHVHSSSKKILGRKKVSEMFD